LTPTPEDIADVLKLVELGGDPGRLAEVCLHQARQYQGEAKRRLLKAAAALDWTAKMLAALNADREVRARG